MLPVVSFISRVRTSVKLKQNKTDDGQLNLKRSPDRRQLCFIPVLDFDWLWMFYPNMTTARLVITPKINQ